MLFFFVGGFCNIAAKGAAANYLSTDRIVSLYGREPYTTSADRKRFAGL